jgi:hypothetical protein
MGQDIFEFEYLSANVELTAAPARFLKEITRVGRFRGPAGRRKAVGITAGRLRAWVDNFAEAGVKVWVLFRDSARGEDRVGWVEDVFVDGAELYAVIRVTDERAAALLRDGAAEDVAVGVERGFVDGAGGTYDEILRYIAFESDLEAER